MGRIKLKGPPRDGAEVFDEGALTHAVLDSYGDAVDQATARKGGQAAGAAVLEARRRLWALAERLVPRRLAAALRARSLPGDPTARDGVRELRLAIADWLDPPPCCRWCRRPIRPGDETRACGAGRRGPRSGGEEHVRADLLDHGIAVVVRERPWTPRRRTCRPSRVRRDVTGRPECGTLALYPAGYADLATMAAMLECPRGAAGDYDVAADRDARALIAATGPGPRRRHAEAPAGEGTASWSSDSLAALYAAVEAAGPPDFPPPLQQARRALDRARDACVRTNGRIATAVQIRYYAPQHGAARADLLQGAAIGVDRASLDYDKTKAAFATHAAEWAGQGCGEAWQSRDLVDTPPWVADLRRRAVAALVARGAGPDAAADLLRAVEALVEVGARRGQRSTVEREARISAVSDLGPVLNLLDIGALREIAAEAIAPPPPVAKWHARLRKGLRGSTPRPPWATRRKAGSPDRTGAQIVAALAEDPERARERVCAVVGRLLGLAQAGKDATGSGLLSALRHGAPVFVPVGSGGDDGDEAQGTDGAGGLERRAAPLAAPDDHAAWDEESDAAAEYARALSHLAALRAMPGDGPLLAEVVRRHLGLDSAVDDAGTGPAATGESFARIGATGIGPDRRVVTKETARKAFNRAVYLLRQMAAGEGPCAADDLAWLEWADDAPVAPLRLRPAPAAVRTLVAPPTERRVVDAVSYESFREAAASVLW